MKNNFRILVVDDEVAYCDALALTLETEGYQVICCTQSTQVAEILRTEKVDLIVSDLIMPKLNGVELLKQVKKIKPDLYFIMLTAFGTIENAVEAMKYGAFTYVIKGSDPNNLISEIEKITKLKQDSKPTDTMHPFSSDYKLSTQNSSYERTLKLAAKAAKSDVNILILGESGVGKDVIAQYICSESKRNKNKFIPTNCHTFSNNLLESELFGHEKGAFTGALKTRIGLFEAAKAGTLFLDEIGDIPLATQAKLLRTIETKKITRIGSNDEIEVDFRLITATNKNIEREIQADRFRQDLFYRISTITINVPPLRSRREDLPGLIQFFIQKTCKSLNLEEIQLLPEAQKILLEYSYPGNVRELKNIIERLVVLSDGEVAQEEILSELLIKKQERQWDDLVEHQYPLKELRHEIESKYITSILDKNEFNIPKAAEILGISTRHLFNKIAEYGIKNAKERKAR